MKKIGLLFFPIFCLCLVGCGDQSGYKPIRQQELKYKTVSVKYVDEPVDVSSFDSFDTSKSSFIKEGYYDEDSQYLILNLTGTYYHRCDVPGYIREEFKDSDSLGGYFNKYIKGEYPCYDEEGKEKEDQIKQDLMEQEREKQEEKDREEEERVAAQKELEIQQQQAAAQKKKCESLRAEADREIAKIQSKKSTTMCDAMHSYESQIQQYQNLINNIDREAANAFKGDTPSYLVNAYKSNKIQQYKNEISKLESMYYSASSTCSTEQSYNRQFDELILRRQQTVINEGC